MSKQKTNKNSASQSYFELNAMLNIPKDGKIQIDKDQEAVRAYFLENVNQNTVYFHTLKEKLTYLVEEDYLNPDLLALYPHPEKPGYDYAFIKRLFQKVYQEKFRFQSFMGAYKFYNQYAIKSKDGSQWLERYEDRICFNALELAQGDRELAFELADEMIHQRFQPATPTFMNAGRAKGGEKVSCFLLDIEDSLLSIFRAVNSAAQLSKLGGGVGLNLSNIRESGAPIQDYSNASDGVVPVMKIFEDTFSYANQLGQRDGTGVVYLNVFHPDIYEFLSTKKENADEKIRVKTLSLGLIVPDKYYDLLKSNAPMYLFSPRDVERIYGCGFSYVDISKHYDEMVKNPAIAKYQINARELEQEISKLQQESGYPYIVNIDTVNRANPVDGRIVMSNLCSEIFQPQEPSQLNEDLSYEHIGSDVSCNLGSANMVKMMESPNFERSVEVAIRALTAVTEKTQIEQVPTVKKGNDLYHTIGYGAMGLHSLYAINHIHYGSEPAIELAEAYFYAVNFYSLKASWKIACEKKETFHNFSKSAYADGTYFDAYIEEDFEIKDPQVQALVEHIHMPTAEDWKELKEKVMEDGLYHRNRLAVAPTGSISYINESSASLHPITQRIENRQEAKVGTIYYPAPYLSDQTLPYYQSAFDMDQRLIIDTYAACQKHIDQGMSLTLFMRSELAEGLYEWKEGRSNKMTTRDLNKLRNYAFKKGIKSLYYVRTFTDDGDYHTANHCESCMI